MLGVHCAITTEHAAPANQPAKQGSAYQQLQAQSSKPQQLTASNAVTMWQNVDYDVGFPHLQLLGSPSFTSLRDLTSTIQNTLAMLRVPHAALGVSAASKGAVAGRLLLMVRPGEAWQDCSLTGPAGCAIPGEVGGHRSNGHEVCACQATCNILGLPYCSLP